MSLREQNKAYNRRRILAAAEQIIRAEGMDKLSMRHLARVAGVSLRTPYNLFGSKTEVLIALLQEPVVTLLTEALQLPVRDGVLQRLFAVLARVHARLAEDEAFFRGVYWQMMSSDHAEAREQAVMSAIRVSLPLLQRAQFQGEIAANFDVVALNRHLSILTLALIGMWASSLFGLDELITHIRESWYSTLRRAATGDGLVQLEHQCADALGMAGAPAPTA